MFIEPCRALPQLVPRLPTCDTREAVDVSTYQVAQRMAAERVKSQQRSAGRQHERANAYAERVPTARLRPDIREDRVVAQDHNEHQRDIQKVPVNILEQEQV